METVFVFPNSLFQKNELIDKKTTVYLIEHPVYFTLFNYHKSKLLLHRASMKYYQDYLKKKYKCKTKYVEFKDNFDKIFKSVNSNMIYFYDPVDHLVIKDIKKLAKEHKKKLIIKDTPLFISTKNELTKYKDTTDKYNHDHFYKWQRKRLVVLMNKDKPLKGKWSFDVKNRKPFPDNFEEKEKIYEPTDIDNKYTKEGKNYIEKHFENNPGEMEVYVPFDYGSAKRHLTKFMKERFKCFGPYQDAVDSDILFGCHTVISPILNIGILTPKYVIKTLEKFGRENNIPLPSLEGLIRQIIGWREYVRMLYIFERTNLEKDNHFKHKRRLSDSWFKGVNNDKESTGFKVIDDMINKACDFGYLHHIERLMYMGNFMLLAEIHPKQSFKWFMELFIDSYQWVMYPNVYGMSQYSAGPIMMTRPYFSSSNYIDKMSNYKKRKDEYNKIELNNEKYEWFEVWDALYYYFISKNRNEFKKNYAISRQVSHWDNKSKSEQNKLKKIAKEYFKKY
jgi:deoxyribodipyrimidine photolyase-related protein